MVDVETTFWLMLFAKWQMEWPHVTTEGRCCCQVADVIATDYVLIFSYLRLMLLPYIYCAIVKLCNIYIVVDVKTTFLADVICQVADGIATSYSSWQMLLPVADVIATIGWCVWFLGLCLVADGIAMGLF